MSALRGLVVHVVLLGIASVLALVAWTRDEKPKTVKTDQVEVWSGRPDSLTSITYEAEKLRLQLDARKDSKGRWFVVNVDKTTEKPLQPPSAADGGAPLASGVDGGPPKMEAKRESQRFVAVTEANKLAESVAPLMALRALGKSDPARAEEFGLNKPEGTLKVSFGNKQYALEIGGTTPGGGDRYAKDMASGIVYAISGDVVRNLQFAESRLMERELHEFKPEDVKRVQITKGAQTREIVRVPEKKEGWADAATPDKLDETVGNWMSKVGRLRSNQYVEQIGVPVTPEMRIVRLDYLDAKGKPLGFLELTRVPDDKSNAGFLVQTEFTRWYAQVLKSSAEQVQQDLASVVK